MDKEELNSFWESYKDEQAEIKKEAYQAKLLENKGLEFQNGPLEAIVYYQGVSTYQAEVWVTRWSTMMSKIIAYSYWIIITDNNFKGSSIEDSVQNEKSTIDVIFSKEDLNKMGELDLRGFKFRHFVGNVYRAKFTIGTQDHKIKYQNLMI